MSLRIKECFQVIKQAKRNEELNLLYLASLLPPSACFRKRVVCKRCTHAMDLAKMHIRWWRNLVMTSVSQHLWDVIDVKPYTINETQMKVLKQGLSSSFLKLGLAMYRLNLFGSLGDVKKAFYYLVHYRREDYWKQLGGCQEQTKAFFVYILQSATSRNTLLCWIEYEEARHWNPLSSKG